VLEVPADLGHRRSLAASRSDFADELEEDRQLQEAIRLSKQENGMESSQEFKPQVKGKRKADGDLRTDRVKRAISASLDKGPCEFAL